MEKYYVIPITDSSILIKGADSIYIPLGEYVSKYYSKLMKLEEKRIFTIYSGGMDNPLTDLQKLKIEVINKQKASVASSLKIPLHILAVGNSVRAYEVVTNEMVYGRDGKTHFLSFRQESEEVFNTYYNSEYIRRVKRFINRRNFELIENEQSKKMVK